MLSVPGLSLYCTHFMGWLTAPLIMALCTMNCTHNIYTLYICIQTCTKYHVVYGSLHAHTIVHMCIISVVNMVTGQVHHQVTMDKALISNCFRHPHIAFEQDLHHSRFPGFYDQVRSMPKTISMLAGRLLAICNHIASEQKNRIQGCQFLSNPGV